MDYKQVIESIKSETFDLNQLFNIAESADHERRKIKKAQKEAMKQRYKDNEWDKKKLALVEAGVFDKITRHYGHKTSLHKIEMFYLTKVRIDDMSLDEFKTAILEHYPDSYKEQRSIRHIKILD